MISTGLLNLWKKLAAGTSLDLLSARDMSDLIVEVERLDFLAYFYHPEIVERRIAARDPDNINRELANEIMADAIFRHCQRTGAPPPLDVLVDDLPLPRIITERDKPTDADLLFDNHGV